MKRLLMFSILICASSGSGAATPFVEAHAGLLGLGAEVGVDFGLVRLRAQTSQYDYDSTQDFDGVDYDTTLDLGATGVLIDLAPFAGAFHVTAGFYDNGVAISGNGRYTAGDQVGGVPFTGTVYANADFDDLAPYVGVGWHVFNASDREGLGLSLDLGLYVNGSADIEMTTDDAVFNAAFQSEIDQEEKNIESDLEKYDTLPVVKLGVSYYF